MVQINKNKGLFKGRYGHSACLVDSDRNLLIYGGSEEDKRSDLIKFNFQSGNFSKVSGDSELSPSARDFHTAVMTDFDKLLIIGVSIHFL